MVANEEPVERVRCDIVSGKMTCGLLAKCWGAGDGPALLHGD